MQTLLALDALDDMIHNAKRVPLSDAARIPRTQLTEAVERVRRGLEAEFGDARESRPWRALERLEELARTAREIPLTDHVRVDLDAVYEVLDELRAALTDDPGQPMNRVPEPVRDGIDALLATAAGPAKPDDLVAVAERLRAAVSTEYDGFRRSRALQALDRLEAIARDRRRTLLTRRVRIGEDELSEIFGEIIAAD